MVGDVFTDNDAVRVIKGATIRESLPPNYIESREGSLQPTFRNQRKRSPTTSNMGNISRAGKRQRVHEPERLLPTIERIEEEEDEGESPSTAKDAPEYFAPHADARAIVPHPQPFAQNSSQQAQPLTDRLSPVTGEVEEDEEDAPAKAKPVQAQEVAAVNPNGKAAPYNDIGSDDETPTTSQPNPGRVTLLKHKLSTAATKSNATGAKRSDSSEQETRPMQPSPSCNNRNALDNGAQPADQAQYEQDAMDVDQESPDVDLQHKSVDKPIGVKELPEPAPVSDNRRRSAAVEARTSISNQYNQGAKEAKRKAAEDKKVEAKAVEDAKRKVAEGKKAEAKAAKEAKLKAKEEKKEEKRKAEEARKAAAAAAKIAEAQAKKKLPKDNESASNRASGKVSSVAAPTAEEAHKTASNGSMSVEIPATSSGPSTQQRATPIVPKKGLEKAIESKTAADTKATGSLAAKSGRRVSFVEETSPSVTKPTNLEKEASTNDAKRRSILTRPPFPFAKPYLAMRKASIPTEQAMEKNKSVAAAQREKTPPAAAREDSQSDASTPASVSSASSRGSRSPVVFVNSAANLKAKVPATKGDGFPGSAQKPRESDSETTDGSSEEDDDDLDTPRQNNKISAQDPKSATATSAQGTRSQSMIPPPPPPRCSHLGVYVTPKPRGASVKAEYHGTANAESLSASKADGQDRRHSTTPVPVPTTLSTKLSNGSTGKPVSASQPVPAKAVRPAIMRHLPSLREQAAEALKLKEDNLAKAKSRAAEDAKRLLDLDIKKRANETEEESEASSTSSSDDSSSSSSDSDSDDGKATPKDKALKGMKDAPATTSKVESKKSKGRLDFGQIKKRFSLGSSLK